MDNHQFKYEVAFSFMQQDEKLAYQINDLIQDRYTTFIYSEHQKELVGKDGEKEFNEVFGQRARLVVILYREGWGKTPWTRIEETAIRNRAHDNGWDFTVFVQLDPNNKLPPWVPKNRLYGDFNRWGAEGLAPVIEARVQDAGGKGEPESIDAHAERLERQVKLEEERQEYLRSGSAYASARLEFIRLVETIKEKIPMLQAKSFYSGQEDKAGEHFAIRYQIYSLHFDWRYEYSNTLDGSGLDINLAKYETRDETMSDVFAQQMFGRQQERDESIKHEAYNFDFNPATNAVGWSKKGKDTDFFSSEELVEQWLKVFIENVTAYKLRKP